MEIYVRKDGVKYGPYSIEQLWEQVDAGRFAKDAPATVDGRNWVTVAEVPTSSLQEGDEGGMFGWWEGSMASLIALLLPVVGVAVAMVVGVVRAWMPDEGGLATGQQVSSTFAGERNSSTADSEALAEGYRKRGLEYANKGEYGKAIENLKKALSILLKTLGSGHLDVAESYHSLGKTYAAKGEREEAKACLLKAKVIRVDVLGPDHPQTKETLAEINGLE